MLTRRSVIAGSLALAACQPGEPTAVGRKMLAVTMDDFNLPEDEGLALERDLRIRSALPVRAAAFVSGKYETRPAFDRVLSDWADDGHIIANHSYSHLNSSSEETDVITEDIARNHDLLSGRRGFAPYFRFPFLAAGRDLAQQDAYRAFLSAAGYTIAPVTIDTYDWNVTGRLEKPDASPRRIGGYYIASVLMMANYAHDSAIALGLRDLPHLMLVHHNALNALFLKPLLRELQSDGWEIVDAKTAMDHPVMAGPPPRIEGWGNRLNLLRRAEGITEPAFPAELREFGTPAMDALGL